jgi:hypothetical protein
MQKNIKKSKKMKTKLSFGEWQLIKKKKGLKNPNP